MADVSERKEIPQPLRETAVGNFLNLLVEGTGDDFILLGAGQLDEADGVAGNTDGQLGILFRMLLGIQQCLLSEQEIPGRNSRG